MHGNIPASVQDASSAAADFCRQRQLLAEPLWFAVFLREAWGPNAAKELLFVLGQQGLECSERTCRAWSAGDNEPPARILIALLLTPLGPRLLDYITRGTMPKWRADELEDQRQAGIFRAAMRDVGRSE